MDFTIVIAALTKIVTDIIDFIPRLINGLVILLIGLLVARTLSWLVARILARIGFDPLVERIGVTGALRGLGIATPLSKIVAQTLFVLLLLSFLITSARLMGLEPVAQLLEQLLRFVPNAIAALIIFLLGGVAAQFVGNLVAVAAASAGLRDARRAGQLVQYLISMFVVILALGQLGVDTALLVMAATILLASFGLALSLALGLGARRVVHHLLVGYYLRSRFPVGTQVELDQVRGEVSGVSGVTMVIQTGTQRVVIPNGSLLTTIVRTNDPAASGTTPEQQTGNE